MLQLFKSQHFGYCGEIVSSEENATFWLCYQPIVLSALTDKALHYKQFTECLGILKNFTRFLQIR